MLSFWVIRRSLHIDKIHKNKKYFVPYNSNFVIKISFLSTLLHMLEVGERKLVPRITLRDSPANQTAWNKDNDEELELLYCN